MEDPSYDTPEETAIVGFPSRYVRVERVNYSHDGSRAKVALLTNEEPYLYPYFVYCEKGEDGRWRELYSTN